MTGTDIPHVITAVPGPRSRALVDVLARHECPAITARRTRRADAIGAADVDPIVWDQAFGANISDVDGNRYVDLSAGFGVALLGHRNPAVVQAAHAQLDRCVHAMGDAFPDQARIKLLERLAAICPGELSVSLLGLSGADAIDAAVKTAVLATGRTGVLTFEGGYHGLALGVLGLQGYKEAFSEPFSALLHPDVTRLPYACGIDAVEEALSTRHIGLVLVEPVLGRGGTRAPPAAWLIELADCARRHGAVIAFDEILTGLGRTGSVFAAPQAVVPDLLCIGKVLGGGFPLSACVGTPEVMGAWGASTGEAIHTQTFLGHPVGCAAALAVLDAVSNGLADAVAARGRHLCGALTASGFDVRGQGLLLAVSVGQGRALAESRRLLGRGFVVLPADGDALQLTPPVCLSDGQIASFVAALGEP